MSKVTYKQISKLKKAIESSTEMLRAEIASNIWKNSTDIANRVP